MSVMRKCISQMFQPKILATISKENQTVCRSHKLMLEAGLIQPSSPGAFTYLPMTQRAIEKLVQIIDAEMKGIGGEKIAMPSLGAGVLWKKSDRWTTMGQELYKLKDRTGVDYCLSPTHEETVTDIVSSFGNLSHHNLPIRLYQVTTKFRDEPRPKFGLLRGKEFLMKDMYSFDESIETSKETYHAVCEAYHRVFDKLGLNCIQAVADTGTIGGDFSHEFHLLSSIGEDQVFHCPKCGYAVNKEVVGDTRPHCPLHSASSDCNLKLERGIEVGHSFLLSTKYSKIFDATFKDETGENRLTEMGCYGLGVSRILAASLEVMSSEEEVRWPLSIAPFQVCIITPKKGSKEEAAINHAENLYDEMVATFPNLQNEVVLDDRTKWTIGKRLLDVRKKGYPNIIIVGKGSLESPAKYEFIHTNTGFTTDMTKEELFRQLAQIPTL